MSWAMLFYCCSIRQTLNRNLTCLWRQFYCKVWSISLMVGRCNNVLSGRRTIVLDVHCSDHAFGVGRYLIRTMQSCSRAVGTGHNAPVRHWNIRINCDVCSKQLVLVIVITMYPDRIIRFCLFWVNVQVCLLLTIRVKRFVSSGMPDISYSSIARPPELCKMPTAYDIRPA